MARITKELKNKYKDVLDKPLGELTEKEMKKLQRFFDEASKTGLTDEEIYEEN